MTETNKTEIETFEIGLHLVDHVSISLRKKIKKIVDIVIDGSVGDIDRIQIKNVTVFRSFVNVTLSFPLDTVYSINNRLNKDGWYVNWIQVMVIRTTLNCILIWGESRMTTETYLNLFGKLQYEPCSSCDIPEDSSCLRNCPYLGQNYDDMTLGDA